MITYALNILGTQEIIILLIIAIPCIVVFLVLRFIRNLVKRNRKAAGIQIAGEIEKLFALKEKGIITQQEFDNRKSVLLHQ